MGAGAGVAAGVDVPTGDSLAGRSVAGDAAGAGVVASPVASGVDVGAGVTAGAGSVVPPGVATGDAPGGSCPLAFALSSMVSRIDFGGAATARVPT